MALAKQLRVEYLALKKLLPYARNARTHSDEQVAQIAASIKEFGFTNPILLSKGVDIIAGHGRALAAASLKMQTVPCIRLGHLSESQRKAYALADNRLALNAGWDLEMLSSELKDLQLDGFDLDLLGFDSTELEDYLAENTANAGNTDPDAVPENVETRCKPGDLWQLGAHRLLCGDSTNVQHVERLMGGEKADMVFTDPPYGVSYQAKNKMLNGLQPSLGRLETPIHGDDLSVDDLKDLIRGAFNNINLVLADKSSYYVASPQGGELGLMMMMMQESNIPCRHMIIWVKNAPVFSVGRLDYDYKHEPILFGWSPNRTHFKSTQEGQWKTSVWDCPREPNKLHPTMKPVDLIVNAITNSCPANGRVFDPFSGSGSTIMACEKTNRRGFGMEIDPHYCDVILKRWEDFSGKKAKRIGKAESEKGAKKVASRKQGRTAVRDHGSASA